MRDFIEKKLGFSKDLIEKKLGIDTESRNKQLLQSIHVPVASYNHAIYVDYLNERNLEPKSLHWLSRNIRQTEQFQHVVGAYVEHRDILGKIDYSELPIGEHIRMGTSSTKAAEEKLNREVIAQYVQALRQATNKSIEHQARFNFRLMGYNHETKRPALDFQSGIDLSYWSNKITYKVS